MGLLVAFTPLLAGLSRALHDVQLRLLAPRQPSTEVLVFDIDDASLAMLKPHFGAWPFKRDVYALVIEQLRELGAQAIAIDLLLADAGPGDLALARALARPGAPVVLAAAGMRHATDGAVPRSTTPSVPPAAAGVVPHSWPALALPTPSVWPAGGPPRLGVITTPLDADGVLRRLPLWHQDSARQLPVMPWALLMALNEGAPPRALEPALPPLDRQGAYHLVMPPPGAWPEVRRFADLARAALGERDAADLREQVRGRVVFIGSSALLADAVMTPQGQVSGTVALAQALAALRQGNWARPAAPWLNAALLLLALVPALATVRRGRAAPPRDAAMAGLTLLVLAGLALWALLQWRQPTAWAAPLAVLAAALGMSLFEHQRGQAAARRRMAHELAVSVEAARAKSAFLANVSHEIRTPLNALLGVAELLSQTTLTPQQRLHVQVFRESGQALHSLINDLLDLSKIEAGRLELNPAPFDLHHMLRQLTNLMRPRAEDKGLNLRLDVDPGLPAGVLGDRLRVEQGLINLVGNAIKFTSRGEVRIGVQPDPLQPGVLCFEVTDTGIGIAPSKLETIFEPFAQADGSVTRIYGGTGLGLAITRQVATLMGGAVQVQSTPGVGSTFTLRVPLPAAAVPAATAETAPAPPAATLPRRAAPISVLLAEDNEVNVYLFSAMLEGEPLTLQCAPNGPTALDLLRRRPFDIAFIDVQMPGMDGLSVTRELRALEAATGRVRTPVVSLTANAFASDVQASLEAGCDRHVAKPFARAQLIEAIVELTGTGTTAMPSAQPAPAAKSSAPAMPGAAGERIGTPLLDRDGAVQRLGGDTSLYQRLTEHAAVFMADWAEAFEQARLEGSRERAHRLAHDLKSIAATVGAHDLADHAAVLERSLRGPDGPCAPDNAACQRTLAALNPVIAALTTPRTMH